MDSENMVSAVKYAVLLVVLAVSLYFDIKENKIKNFITIPAALSGLSLNFYEHGINGLVLSSKGLLLPLAVLLVFYIINVMGAGDIKLFAAIGAIMGLPFVAHSMLLSLCIGAIISVWLLIWRRQFTRKIKKVYYYFLLCFLSRRLALYTERGNKDSKFPFSIAIVPAVLITFFYGIEKIKIY